MGTGVGQPAAQAQQTNTGFNMNSFMQQLLPQLFGSAGGAQPAGFGSIAMPQPQPSAPFPQAPGAQIPNLMAGFGKTNQQLAQQHAMPFPPPPIRPTPVAAPPPTTGGTKLSFRDQVIEDRKKNPKTNAVTRARERRG